MSVLIVVCGSASNSAQLHLPSKDPPSCSERFQFSTLICGVGPAERTGKSLVTYCPGGTRFFGVCSCRVDLNPREIGALSMVVVPLLLELPMPATGSDAFRRRYEVSPGSSRHDSAHQKI